MVQKEIKWSKESIKDLIAICEYWTVRNGSNKYSIKLQSNFIRAIEILSFFPESGLRTSKKQIYVKVVRDYKVFYRIASTYVIIEHIWDTRRNPQNLKL